VGERQSAAKKIGFVRSSRRYSRKGILPITEFQASRALALPLFNRIRENEINEVCRTLVDLIRSVKAAGP
jgi:hypothetical protein